MPTRDRFFLDSNVLLYALDKSSRRKKDKVYKILRDHVTIISPQVIFECLNVAIRKFKRSKKDALGFISLITKFSEVANEDSLTVSKALQLYHRHSLQVFDSKIIAVALLADCKILYSEDLQHGQVFERKLKIINPFL